MNRTMLAIVYVIYDLISGVFQNSQKMVSTSDKIEVDSASVPTLEKIDAKIISTNELGFGVNLFELLRKIIHV